MTQDAMANPAPVTPIAAIGRKRRVRNRTAISAHGQPMVWLSGGSLVLALAMIVGLLGLIVVQGAVTFWPQPIVRVETLDGKAYLGEASRQEDFQPGPDVLASLPADVAAAARPRLAESGGHSQRRQIRTGNFELTGLHFVWVSEFLVKSESRPEWAVIIERQTWGRFYGIPVAFELDGRRVATDAPSAWKQFSEHHDEVRHRWAERRRLEVDDLGQISRTQEQARLEVRKVELKYGTGSAEHLAAARQLEKTKAAADQDAARIGQQITELNRENDRFRLIVRTADGVDKPILLADIVRAYPANQLGFLDKCRVYASRWWEFLSAEPREANSEGGVWPAIVGTLVMTVLMSLMVVPFGVLAALYLREYAKGGLIVSLIRIAVNNLAGVPSIVFGVFGLGFFCYIVGGGIDSFFYPYRLPNPTFGKTALVWASLTLALLTLPVVIVATEEALSAVPNSMREGSYGCGAGKWQTIWRIVLPRAMPGVMTGMILAVARAAGEVAPLMLVGAVKLAPDLPLDGTFPFVHMDRSFMHLGFHIFDLGFQSQNSEAAKPVVFTTTLLLIAIIAVLNVGAIRLRSRFSRRFVTGAF